MQIFIDCAFLVTSMKFGMISKGYQVRYQIKGLNVRSILRLETSFDLILIKSL